MVQVGRQSGPLRQAGQDPYSLALPFHQGTATRADRRGTTAPPTHRQVQDVAVLSASSVVRGQLAGLIRAGGAMSFISTDASPFTRTEAGRDAYADLPFDARGLPDFDAMRAGGGTVTGGVPGGFDISGWNDGAGNQVTFFAAEVTQPGKPAQFVKGMHIELSGAGSAADRRQFIEGAARYFDRLPSTAAQARQQAAQQLPTFVATVD